MSLSSRPYIRVVVVAAAIADGLAACRQDTPAPPTQAALAAPGPGVAPPSPSLPTPSAEPSADDVFSLVLWAEAGELEDVRRLVKQKPSIINRKNQFGWTAMHTAALRAQLAVLEFLIDTGGDVEAKGGDDATPLHLAARGGDRDATRLLLEHQADPNALRKDGQTPVHEAARDRNLGALRALLEAHAKARRSHDVGDEVDAASRRGVQQPARGSRTPHRGGRAHRCEGHDGRHAAPLRRVIRARRLRRSSP